jgi:hypothetical protein
MDEYLIKEAFLSSAAKFFARRAKKGIGGIKMFLKKTKGGFPKGPLPPTMSTTSRAINSSEGLSSLRSPISHITTGKGGSQIGKINVPDANKNLNMATSLRESIGDTAFKVKSIGEGVKGKGIFGGTVQAFKNTNNVFKNQLKQDFFREVDVTKGTILKNKKGQEVFRDKTFFGNVRDRAVSGTTNRNTVVVKQRKRAYPLALATGGSGASMAGLSYLGADSEKSQASRIGTAATEGAIWGMSGPAGMAYSVIKGIKENKKQKATQINN